VSVSRRGFLAGLLAAPVVAALPDELWVPSKKIFLPPKGGWTNALTLDVFTQEYIAPAMKAMAMQINNDIIYWLGADGINIYAGDKITIAGHHRVYTVIA
jgi:hypothetical protein